VTQSHGRVPVRVKMANVSLPYEIWPQRKKLRKNQVNPLLFILYPVRGKFWKFFGQIYLVGVSARKDRRTSTFATSQSGAHIASGNEIENSPCLPAGRRQAGKISDEGIRQVEKTESR